MDKEIWKDIEGYEGLYQVSNLGRVKSLPKLLKNRWGEYKSKEKIMKPIVSQKGYYNVSLRKDKNKKYCAIHRLVAQAFISNPLNLPQVNHKDEDKTNNCVGNLEWCTNYYNENYGTKNARRAEKLCKKVIQYTKEGNLIREWNSIKETEKEGFNRSHVTSCCKGRRKSHKGFIWKYK